MTDALISPSKKHPIVKISTAATDDVDVVSIWFKSGARYDKPGFEGFSHALEHMFLCLKTKEGRTLKDYFSTFVSEYSLKTSVDFINLKYVCNAQEAKSVFETICWSLRHAYIEKEEFETEKRIILNEIEYNSAISDCRYFNIIRKVLWDGPVANSILGGAECVRCLSLELVEKVIQTLWAARCFFILHTGSLEDESMEAALKNSIRSDTVSQDFLEEGPVYFETHAASATKLIGSEFTSVDADIVNATLAYLPTCNGRGLDSISLNFLCRCIAFGNAGCVAKRLREGSLALYYIMAMPVRFSFEKAIVINYVTKKDAVNEARALISEEMAGLLGQLKTNEQFLSSAKKSLINDIQKAHMTAFRSLDFIGESLICDNSVLRYEETLERIHRTSISDLELLSSHFNFSHTPAPILLDGKQVRYA